jgi:hypothetical protein
MDEPRAENPPPEAYPALRATRRALLGLVLLFAVVYYNADLLPMVGHTLIPFAALFGTGIVLGTLAPRRLPVATFTVWWLVILAAALRRSALSDVPLGTEIFGGALAKYPTWGAWTAEALRLAVYLWALWLGGKAGRRLFRRSALGGP